MPSRIFSGEENPLVVDHFGLEVQGIEQAHFREVGGYENSHDVIEHRETDSSGKQYIIKQPGNLKVGDVSLKWGMTSSLDLFDWRQEIIEGKVDEARKDCSIIMYNQSGEPVGRVELKRAWPSKYKAPDVNTSNNNVAVEEITLACEEILRTQ